VYSATQLNAPQSVPRERTHNQQLKDIADGGLKSVEQLKYFAEWLKDYLDNLEKLKKELGK
jgi:hypothetical protein